MSTGTAIIPLSLPLITGRVRAYFAPISAGLPTPLETAMMAGWQIAAPPSPWVDLGWLAAFARSSDSELISIETGSPATVQLQARQKVGATVHCRFERWNRLTMALAAGSDSVNLLQTGSTALPLAAGSNAGVIYVSGTPSVSAGSFLVIDEDYSGQTGFVGAGSAGAYIQNAAAIAGDADFIRRCSLNVAQVSAIRSDGGLQLGGTLLAGTPTTSMKAQIIMGFADREGGTFLPEWSGLFVAQGTQGEKLFFYYPRLQSIGKANEAAQQLGANLQTLRLEEIFRALPVTDKTDGAATVCYRAFLPAPACRI